MKNNIVKLLKENNMSQREFAEKLETTEVSISRYINGDRLPKISTCIQMAKILGCKVEDLYYEEDNFSHEKEIRYKWSKEIIDKIDKAGCLSKKELGLVEIALRFTEALQELLQ